MKSKQKVSQCDKVPNLKSNNQTIDSVRTSNKDFNTSYIKDQKVFGKKNSATHKITKNTDKTTSNSSRVVKN